MRKGGHRVFVQDDVQRNSREQEDVLYYSLTDDDLMMIDGGQD
jgi:hypothetical protein